MAERLPALDKGLQNTADFEATEKREGCSALSFSKREVFSGVWVMVCVCVCVCVCVYECVCVCVFCPVVFSLYVLLFFWTNTVISLGLLCLSLIGWMFTPLREVNWLIN